MIAGKCSCCIAAGRQASSTHREDVEGEPKACNFTLLWELREAAATRPRGDVDASFLVVVRPEVVAMLLHSEAIPDV